MKITELNIAEFGCFKNKKIDLSAKEKGGSDFNIIYGENESGKSTLLMFIKFMLYGLGRKSSSNSERERSLSWLGHTASGSMTFIHEGKAYRVERRYSEAARGGSEKLSLICLDDGREINAEDGVGEYFLGVPREVFESSACVGQLSASQINGEKISGSIQNILSSADETVDTAKIMKGLDAVRVTYRHKNKNGGSLYDTEQLIALKRSELQRARDATMSLDEQTQRLETAKRDYELARADFQQKDALITQFNKINLIKRFEKYAEMQGESRELVERTEQYKRDNLNTEFLPKSSHIAELKLSAKVFAESDKNLRQRQTAMSEAVPSYEEELALLGEQLEADGGKTALETAFKEKNKQIKSIGITLGVLTGLGAVAAASGIWLILAGTLAGAGAFAGLLIPAVFALVNSKKKKTLRGENSALLEKYGTNAKELESRLALCEKHFEMKKAYIILNQRANEELERAERIFEGAKSDLQELMAKTLPGKEASCENAMAEAERLESFIEKYQELLGEQATLKRMMENERETLDKYDESLLREQISVDVSEATPAAMAEAERQRTFLLRKKEAFEQKIFALNDHVSQLRANAKNPLPLADELAELEDNYKKESDFYEALTLAIESIGKSGEVMSGSVMPAIAEQAGKLVARITDDKYTQLRATGNFSLTLDSDGFGIKSHLLSSGTRDVAYLSLRIALLNRIFDKGLPPFILDEALCQLDEVRCKRLMEVLKELGEQNIQCLLFTSHRRENEICNSLGIECNPIAL